MANPLRKTMVYLGLADEEYDDEQPQPAPAAASPASTPQPGAPAQAPQAAPAAAGRAPVTPLRRTTASPRPTQQAAEMNEILTVHPRQYKDAQVIAENFREGIPVIINLSQMTESDARRLVDFSSGLTLGLRGKIERVTAKVFLLSPEHISVSGEQPEGESDVEASFFAHQ